MEATVGWFSLLCNWYEYIYTQHYAKHLTNWIGGRGSPSVARGS